MVTRCTSRAYVAAVFLLAIVSTAPAKYSGGTGEPNDPYRIATAADLIALGETADDYDKHFILTADIDLDPDLPGRKVFDRAVIAPDTDAARYDFQGTDFTGVFDGNGHTISHLTIKGKDYLGLLGGLGSHGAIRNLGVVDVNVTGSGSVGGLVGDNDGTVTQCYSTGAVSGTGYSVGGLVGDNYGTVTQCYSTGAVDGWWSVGGLVGDNYGTVTQCYSTGAVRGTGDRVGGLVGYNGRTLTQCYSTGAVSGWSQVGGLVGLNGYLGTVLQCYSSSPVDGNDAVGGLVGSNDDWVSISQRRGVVTTSFWDTQTSSQAKSAGGTGKTTNQMRMASTFLGWGTCGNQGVWTIDEGRDYPRLWWENQPGRPIAVVKLSDLLRGTGTQDDPFLIGTPEELNAIGLFPCGWDKHYKLLADVDLSAFDGKEGRPAFNIVGWGRTGCGTDSCGSFGIPFTGVFDGNKHAVVNFTFATTTGTGWEYIGLFGYVVGGEIKDLRLIDPNVRVIGGSVGGLVGWLEPGSITRCSVEDARVEGAVVGGLVGSNSGTVTQSYSTGAVTGESCVGGLVGRNWSAWWEFTGTVAQCYSSASVSGTGDNVGALVGYNDNTVTQCYSTGAVNGSGPHVGGLVGDNGWWGVTQCFWDIQTSGQTTSAGGTGKTTAEMQDPNIFIADGWDFVGLPDGPHDIWAEREGGGYPILWWQLSPLANLPGFSGGAGEPSDPYRISRPEELNSIGHNPRLMGAHFALVNDIDLGSIDFYIIGSELSPFSGSFDGNGHAVSHLTLKGEGPLGMFAQLASGAEVKDLGVVDANITGSWDYVGGLVGSNGSWDWATPGGTIMNCYSTGAASGEYYVGGLVGFNDGTVTQCYSGGAVDGNAAVGGLVGLNGYRGTVIQCYCSAAVSGSYDVGGLAGGSYYGGQVAYCYSIGVVSGKGRAGGLVGDGYVDSITSSFWDTQTSGQATSAGGIGKTTAEMHTAKTFLDAGWDFVGETAKGTADIWWIDEGKDYPRLWWEPRN
jgi:hypothetical protein